MSRSFIAVFGRLLHYRCTYRTSPSCKPKRFLGSVTERILKNVSETIFIYKSLQPFNGLSRMVAAVSSKAELEPGFSHWFAKLSTIAKEAGIPISFHASVETIKEFEEQNRNTTSPVKAAFNPFHNWENFLFLSRELKPMISL